MNEFDPPAIVCTIDMDLEALAFEINAAHEAGEQQAKKGLERFREAGESLLKAKDRIGHGKWLQWLSKNVKFTRYTAARYMRLATNWAKCGGEDTFDAAMKLLVDPIEDEKEKEYASKPASAPTPISKAVTCLSCQRRTRTGQPPILKCKECTRLNVPADQRGDNWNEGGEDDGDDDGESSPANPPPAPTGPPVETRPVPTTTPRTAGGGNGKNGREKWSFKQIKDQVGKVLTLMQDMLHHYKIETEASKPWNANPIIQTPEYLEARKAFELGLDVLERYEKKLKAQRQTQDA